MDELPCISESSVAIGILKDGAVGNISEPMNNTPGADHNHRNDIEEFKCVLPKSTAHAQNTGVWRRCGPTKEMLKYPTTGTMKLKESTSTLIKSHPVPCMPPRTHIIKKGTPRRITSCPFKSCGEKGAKAIYCFIFYIAMDQVLICIYYHVSFVRKHSTWQNQCPDTTSVYTT